MKLLAGLLVLWNLVTFIMMGIDKRRAIKDKSRISEKTLLTVSFAMGAVGIFAGACVFRHKTQKLKFRLLMPLGVIVNGAVIYALHIAGLF